MKKRNMLFGYKVENGQKVIEEKESKIVVEIYTRYLKRETVLSIANDLTKRRIEYVPSRYEWNKPRVLRVVKDERYIGADKFPPLIDKSVFYAAQSLNSQKRTIKEDFLDKDVHRMGKTMRIKNTLKNTPLQTKFSPELLNSIAEAIKLYPDGDVAIVLINGQEIRR